MSELRMNGNPKAQPVDANTSYLWHGRANLWHSITRRRQKVAYKQPRPPNGDKGAIATIETGANPTQPAGGAHACSAPVAPACGPTTKPTVAAADESRHVRPNCATPNWEVTSATPLRTKLASGGSIRNAAGSISKGTV